MCNVHIENGLLEIDPILCQLDLYSLLATQMKLKNETRVERTPDWSKVLWLLFVKKKDRPRVYLVSYIIGNETAFTFMLSINSSKSHDFAYKRKSLSADGVWITKGYSFGEIKTTTVHLYEPNIAAAAAPASATNKKWKNIQRWHGIEIKRWRKHVANGRKSREKWCPNIIQWFWFCMQKSWKKRQIKTVWSLEDALNGP